MIVLLFVREEIFEKSRQRGSKLKVKFEYSPLPVFNITNDTTEEDFQKNYLDKMKDEEIDKSEGRITKSVFSFFSHRYIYHGINKSGAPITPKFRQSLTISCEFFFTVAGVVCVCIHKAQNLLPMDKNGLSDPYCIVYENKREVNIV
jgi:hypothetical protein